MAVLDFADLPVVDNHVHPWRASSAHQSAADLAGSVCFSDTVTRSVREPFLPSDDLAPALDLFRETNLGARYFLRELAQFLGVEADWEAVSAARNALTAADFNAWTGRLFADAGIEALLVDEGGAQPRITLQELGAIAPVQLRRVARVDNVVRDLLALDLDWPAFVDRYVGELESAIREGAVAFKSVIAYRTGLHIEPVAEPQARTNYEAVHRGPELEQKPFRDFLFCLTLDVAREHDLAVHVHAAVGDPDIVYDRARPALLYALLHSQRFRTNRVVLIHAGWPWVGEAAAMAAILPNVYIDVSEGNIYGMPNVRQRLLEALEACPYAKILYGADGASPESTWIVARHYKRVLARVLADLSADGFCDRGEAGRAARMILHDNAVRLYQL